MRDHHFRDEWPSPLDMSEALVTSAGGRFIDVPAFGHVVRCYPLDVLGLAWACCRCGNTNPAFDIETSVEIAVCFRCRHRRCDRERIELKPS